MRSIEKDMEEIIIKCLDSFPKNINFYSDHTKTIVAKEITKQIIRRKKWFYQIKR